MICELSIQNVAVIEKLNINFKTGMSVLTGETGAGKSIIIDSINMILGNKADKSLIRYGEEKAMVSAVFDVSEELRSVLAEKEVECEEGQLFISRTISQEGKSVCRINGIAVPLSQIREIAPYLINIHGQHDNQALLTASKHIRFIDAYAMADDTLSEYKKLYLKLRDAKKRLSELYCDDDERLRRADLLEYQIKEIEEADLKDGEEEELKEQKGIILNAEKITTSAAEAKEALYSDNDMCAYNNIYKAVSALEKIEDLDEGIKKARETLLDILYSVQDISEEVMEFSESAEYDERALDEIEERLDVYSKLKRKYGATVSEINAFLKNASEELKTLQNIDENIENMKVIILDIEKKITKKAEELSKIRKASAKELSERIEKSLHELNMPAAKFVVNIEKTEDFTQDGCEKIEFLISANAGEPEKSLGKIASGGELSRVMLAMKSVLSECDGVDTLIFDEIDTGVSGSAAQKIADKLSEISKKRQVICITHLPQLASMADNHYFIEKNTEDGKTKTTVWQLNDEERVLELARITGGELSEISKQHARELIKEANLRKCK